MIEATNTASDFKPVDAGTYMARCYSMVHIGTVEQEYMGEKKDMNKVRVTWELPTELTVFKEEEGEKPFSVSKEFTLSMHEKANLRKFLEGWRGKGFSEDEAKKFDITKLLGVPCMISIIHKTSKQGRVYAEIISASALPKGLECPPQINPNFEFTYTPFSQAKYDSLPDWLKDKIRTSREYKEIVSPGTEDSANEDDDTSVPF